MDARGRHVSNGGHWGHCSDACKATSQVLPQVIKNVAENEGDDVNITVKEFVFVYLDSGIINHLNKKGRFQKKKKKKYGIFHTLKTPPGGV